MGAQYKTLTREDITFIKKQKLFYIASSSTHEVNLSPRGYDCIHVDEPSTLYMADYLGSGNRTARDIAEDGEITLLFNAFEDEPKILRCFCKGEVIMKDTQRFEQAGTFFKADMDAIRHIFKFTIYAVETSCGMGIPVMRYEKERKGVKKYALQLAKDGTFEQYVKDHAVPPDLHKL